MVIHFLMALQELALSAEEQGTQTAQETLTAQLLIRTFQSLKEKLIYYTYKTGQGTLKVTH